MVNNEFFNRFNTIFFTKKRIKDILIKKLNQKEVKNLLVFKKLDDLNHSGEILIQSKNKVQTKKDFDTIYHYTIKNKKSYSSRVT